MSRSTLAVSALLAATTSVALGDIVAASNIAAGYSDSPFFTGVGFGGSSGFTNQASGQQFTAGASGEVTTVSALLSRQASNPSVALDVSIHESIFGIPGSRLGGVEIAASEIATGSHQLYTFDFSGSGVSLASGTDYVLVFSVDVPGQGTSRYSIQLIEPNEPFGEGYVFSRNGGATWNDSNLDVEMGLEIRVVPAPGVCSLCLGGSIALRRRRRI